jgi:hypothetical protein
MPKYNEWKSGGDPVHAIRVPVVGIVLVDAKDRVVTDEHGEAYHYATIADANTAIANFRRDS